ncbi:hypothetical protein WJX81_007320 [Elliptochloris bilobata]|uniref:CRAL-TRIO domain-containing protein n=1 Tax=Elliptochloris bilobata TaxID=381761 RepID=A0AAW1QH62_9CHLO
MKGDQEGGLLERGGWLRPRRLSASVVRTVGPADAPGEPVGWVRAGSTGRVSPVSLARTLSQQVGSGVGLGAGLATCVANVPMLPPAPWNRKLGHLGHLSAEQESALAALRARFPESPAFHTDYDLLRFLRAREFDLKAAAKMYNEYCTVYRPGLLTLPLPFLRPALGSAYRLCALAAAGFPERPPEQTARLAPLLRIIHAAALGTDPDMRPVVYLRPAAMVKSPAQPPLADRLALQSASNEATRLLCALASAAAGYQVEEVVQVIDLASMSPLNMLQHVRRDDAQSEWQHNMDFCPETLNKVIIINAPLGSGLVWKAASVFLPASTRQKIAILPRGSHGQAELHRLVGKSNVPTCYGGTGERFEWPSAEPVNAPPGSEAPAEKAAAALAAVGSAMGHAVSNAVRELEALPGCIRRESMRTL